MIAAVSLPPASVPSPADPVRPPSGASPGPATAARRHPAQPHQQRRPGRLTAPDPKRTSAPASCTGSGSALSSGMSSPPATLRRLGPTDVPLLRELNALFGDAFGDRETYGGEPPTDAYLEGLLTQEHVIAIVALAGGKVLGGLVAYELDKFER